MTQRPGVSSRKGADNLRGRIWVAERRVADAKLTGWRALEASWQATLDQLVSELLDQRRAETVIEATKAETAADKMTRLIAEAVARPLL